MNCSICPNPIPPDRLTTCSPLCGHIAFYKYPNETKEEYLVRRRNYKPLKKLQGIEEEEEVKANCAQCKKELPKNKTRYCTPLCSFLCNNILYGESIANCIKRTKHLTRAGKYGYKKEKKSH